MDTLETIYNRRSIHKYTSEKIPEEKIEQILKAAMYAPSARNIQPWHFIVVDKRESIDQISKLSPHAEMMTEAMLAIIICGDSNLDPNMDNLIMECSAATQNALLAIQALGLGGIWVSSYPIKEAIDGIRKYYEIPENIVPVSIIALGYPAEQATTEDRYNKARVHRNNW